MHSWNLVLKKSSVRPHLHVTGCEMAHLLARRPRHILSVFNLVLDIYVIVKWQLSKKVSADQCHMVFNWLWAQVYFLKRNRPFPSFPGPLHQNEVRCSTFDMEMIFHSHANKTHFQKKSWAPKLVLIQRPGGTRKWPIHFTSCLRQSLERNFLKDPSRASLLALA